jgi:hypothetical protein
LKKWRCGREIAGENFGKRAKKKKRGKKILGEIAGEKRRGKKI